MPGQSRQRIVAMAIVALGFLAAASPASAGKPEPLEPTHPGLVRAKATERVKPIYPHDALLAGSPEARVLLRIVVERSGRISQYQVLESSQPDLGFEEAATDMIGSWKYRPAYLDGKKVRSYAYLEVSFVAPYKLCETVPVLQHILSHSEKAYFDDGTMLDEATGDSRPELTRHVDPVYPDLPRRAGIQAVVDVAAHVSEDGTIGDICLIETSQPNLGFEEATVDAVQEWRYKPALRHGKPAPLWVGIRVTFSLQ